MRRLHFSLTCKQRIYTLKHYAHAMQKLTKAEQKSTKTKKSQSESKRKKPLKQQGKTLFGHGKPPLPHPVRAPFPSQTVASESFKQKKHDLRKRLFPSQTVATEKGHATNEKQLLPPPQRKTIPFTLQNHRFDLAKPYLLPRETIPFENTARAAAISKGNFPASKSSSPALKKSQTRRLSSL